MSVFSQIGTQTVAMADLYTTTASSPSKQRYGAWMLENDFGYGNVTPTFVQIRDQTADDLHYK